MNKQCILVLGANQFQRERALIGAEKATEAYVVTVAPNAPFHNNKYPALAIKSDETNPDQLLKDVIEFISTTKMDLIAVIPLNDFVLNAGLAIANYFNLPYNEKSTIENCREKDKMKNMLADANLPIIRSYRFATDDEAVNLANKLGYPLVIKPVNFGGSGGVKKVTHPSELKNAINETRSHLKQHANHYDSDSINMVMEQYITKSHEISVEIINTPNWREVIGITDKFLCTEPYFSEIGHLVPSTLYKYTNGIQQIEELAKQACHALNIRYGMAHVEIKLTEDCSSPVIIEVGARTAGDGIMDLYEKATGKNIYKLHCQSYLRRLQKEDLPKTFLRSAAIGYLHPKPGIIKHINFDLDASETKHIDLIAVKAKPGQEVAAAKNWSTRYGFVEYTFWNTLPNDFNLIQKTNMLTNKLFSIHEDYEVN